MSRKEFAILAAAACAVVATAIPATAQAPLVPKQPERSRVVPTIPPPPPGMGQVVFYRSSMMGSLISCRVRENGQVVNRLPPGKYFVHVTTPGPHEYVVRSEARDVLRLEVEEGETHYVRCAIRMGIGLGRPNLSPQDRADFERRGRGLELQQPYRSDD
ncbi:MAG: DUF2846 domain-containing protein [Pseudomonadota bacterium]|nr:DUF2846 domain-containing protein [Pseudomonadota bacterium]